nr:hypothetical protein [uncultured Mediterranean phage uvMED]
MLRTNSKKYQENFKNYILSVIDSEDLPEYIKTDKEKVNYIFERFEDEYNYENNKRRTPIFQLRFAEWLQGLSINLPYNYTEIIELSKKLLETDQVKNEERIIQNYWSFMALQIIRLNQKLNRG